MPNLPDLSLQFGHTSSGGLNTGHLISYIKPELPFCTAVASQGTGDRLPRLQSQFQYLLAA